MLFMAAALANIDKKLDTIKEMQQEMMDFLIRKETTSNWADRKGSYYKRTKMDSEEGTG